MPVNAQTQAILDFMAELPALDISTITAEEFRAAFDNTPREDEGPDMASEQVLELDLQGRQIKARLYKSKNCAEKSPVILQYHGGGFVLGTLETHSPFCRYLADATGYAVLSVDYRLAPEHVFPAAADDAIEAVDWVKANGSAYGLNAGKIAVTGDSAGGNLAAVAALARPDDVSLQVPLYPVTRYSSYEGSYKDFSEGYMLTFETMVWFWEQYLPNGEMSGDYRAFPLYSDQLENAPKTYVVTAEFDPLKDEGKAYADALKAAGVACEYRDYKGVIHGFASSFGVVDEAKELMRDISARFKAALG